MSDAHTVDHPELSARTRRFSLGRPRSFRIVPEADRVLFLRSTGPEDPVLRLWSLDLTGGGERIVVDAASIDQLDEDLPAEERARRERARESAGGIVQYSTSANGGIAAFTVAGQLFSADLATGAVTAEPAPTGVYDAQVDPTGRRIAFVHGGALHVVARGIASRKVVGDPDPAVTWGVAEFVAAEEMNRQRGHWWSPDGQQLLVARVDNRPVARWWIGDPANPDAAPVEHRYPAAGTANAEVSLALFGVEDGGRVDVTWDAASLPYLAAVRWTSGGPCLLVVQSRDQRRLVTLALDPTDGSTTVVQEQVGDPWLEVPVGAPRWLEDGRLLTIVDDLDAGDGGTRRLAVDGTPVTPAGLQVSSVAAEDVDGIWFTGTDEATEMHVHRLVLHDDQEPEVVRVSSGRGLYGVVASGGTHVLSSVSADSYDLRVTVHQGDTAVGSIPSRHAHPEVAALPEFLELGPDRLRAALLLPADHDSETPLPVILDPYGGPHAQRVVRSRMAFATSQWLADQGFAVLVCDGRGTPNRGPAWEHAIHLDLAEGVLEDQLTALHAAAEQVDLLDLDRVAIRGWSFGGFLSALAVLRRPDVFRAAVAGAPVTDWRLYDTHYTERYLGHPDAEPESYRSSSLIDDDGLVGAVDWDPARPPSLLVIHGLADDNVVAAHALRLSGALLADGRPHQFLPLAGVTHMTPQVTVASNLARIEASFLRDALGVA